MRGLRVLRPFVRLAKNHLDAITVSALRAEPQPYWRGRVSENMMYHPDIVTAKSYMVCWQGVVSCLHLRCPGLLVMFSGQHACWISTLSEAIELPPKTASSDTMRFNCAKAREGHIMERKNPQINEVSLLGVPSSVGAWDFSSSA